MCWGTYPWPNRARRLRNRHVRRKDDVLLSQNAAFLFRKEFEYLGHGDLCEPLGGQVLLHPLDGTGHGVVHRRVIADMGEGEARRQQQNEEGNGAAHWVAFQG